MPNCDFYSVGADSEGVVAFVGSQPGWVLYERSSQPGAEARRFTSLASFTDAFDPSVENASLQLYSAEMRGYVVTTRDERGAFALIP
jgi:hypothetical protein